MQTNWYEGRDWESDTVDPEMSSFYGCTECTTVHEAIPSEGNPEMTWMSPVHLENEKISTSIQMRKAENNPIPSQHYIIKREALNPSLSLESEGFGPHIILFNHSVMDDSVAPWTAAHEPAWSFAVSWTFLKLIFIQSMMLSNHLMLCCSLLLLPSIFPASVFSSESAPFIKWPKYWSFSFSICPSNEYSGLISFRNWLVWSPGSPRDSQKSSPTTQFKSINSLALSPYYGPTLTSILTTYKADIWGMSMLLWLEQPLWLSPMAQCRKGRQKWLFLLFLWRVEYINTLQEKKIEIDSLYLHVKKLEKEQTKAKFRRRKTVKKDQNRNKWNRN